MKKTLLTSNWFLMGLYALLAIGLLIVAHAAISGLNQPKGITSIFVTGLMLVIFGGVVILANLIRNEFMRWQHRSLSLIDQSMRDTKRKIRYATAHVERLQRTYDALAAEKAERASERREQNMTTVPAAEPA